MTETKTIPNLEIETGDIELTINSDPSRVIIFNPSDVLFAERFFSLLNTFEGKIEEYKERSKKLSAVTETDDNNLPVNMPDRLELVKDTCLFIREEIDKLFGPGTSQKSFGDAYILENFEKFFNGITPHINKARGEKIAPYIQPKTSKKKKRSRK